MRYTLEDKIYSLVCAYGSSASIVFWSANFVRKVSSAADVLGIHKISIAILYLFIIHCVKASIGIHGIFTMSHTIHVSPCETGLSFAAMLLTLQNLRSFTTDDESLERKIWQFLVTLAWWQLDVAEYRRHSVSYILRYVSCILFVHIESHKS